MVAGQEHAAERRALKARRDLARTAAEMRAYLQMLAVVGERGSRLAGAAVGWLALPASAAARRAMD